MANHPNRTKLATLKGLAKAAGMTFHRDPYGKEWVIELGRGLPRYLCGESLEKIDEESFKLELKRHQHLLA